MPKGQHTYAEIMSQPAAWTAAKRAFARQRRRFELLWAAADCQQVIVTGCGSTYYLALTVARLLRHSGLDAHACPASELLLHPNALCLPGRRYLLLSLSRSGTTTETVRAQQNFKTTIGGPVITITCDSQSPLAQSANLVFAIDAAQEKSVAQTRSFSSMALVAQRLAAALARQYLRPSTRLPAICQQLLDQHADLARALGEDATLQKFFFLGADALYGIACEAMLKMKEMSLAYSEAYHPLEFRHGPMSMVGADSLVIGLLSPAARKQEVRVLEDMAALGATVLALGQKPPAFARQITLPATVPAWSAPILYLPVLQLLAYRRALFNGCDPDKPHQLSAVIALEDI